MSVDFDDFLAVECAGLFTAKRVAYTVNSMNQADIDAGATMILAIYTKQFSHAACN